MADGAGRQADRDGVALPEVRGERPPLAELCAAFRTGEGVPFAGDVAREVALQLRRRELMDALRSRMEEDPPKNENQIPIISGNVPDSSGPQKPSFGPGSSRTINVFFQKTNQVTIRILLCFELQQI